MWVVFLWYEVYHKWWKLSRKRILKFIKFYHSVGKTSAVLLVTRTNNNLWYSYILALKMAFSREKKFVVYRKSTKTAKVFSHVTFIVYGTSFSDQCRVSTDWFKVSSTIVYLLFWEWGCNWNKETLWSDKYAEIVFV